MFGNFVEKDDNLSDEELVCLIKSGEYDKLQSLIGRYMPLITNIAGRYIGFGAEKDDLVQEGALAVFSAVGVFDAQKASFRTFAELCVTRAMITLCRSLSSASRIPDNLFSNIDDIDISDQSNPVDILIEREDFNFLTEKIRSVLSKREYSVLCAFLCGMSYTEISQTLNISVKSVDNSLKRVRSKIRN